MEGCSLRRTTEKEVVVREVIWPAIQGHSCPICLRDLEARYREAAVLARCSHAYCTDCIRRWSHVRRTCPLCNSEFDSWFCNLSLSSRSFRKRFLPFHSEKSHSHSFNSDVNQPRLRSSRWITIFNFRNTMQRIFFFCISFNWLYSRIFFIFYF